MRNHFRHPKILRYILKMNKRIDSQADILLAVSDLKKRDPLLVPIIEKLNHIPLRRAETGFESLANIITSQLISRAAADAIWEKQKAYFGFLTPQNIAQSTEQKLRNLGLSGAKATTLLGVANKLIDSPEFLTLLEQHNPDKALKELISLKGIGPWTAEVYLLSCCGHPDIFPAGDIALRTASGHAFFDGVQPDQKDLREYSKRWAPWRSVAARILWAYYADIKNFDKSPI